MANYYTFVLWGKNFDEVATTIFVSELRQAGRRVKLVGLDGSQSAGAYGVVLVPDMPLGKALMLADKASCVIIPCDASRWGRIQGDPRVEELLNEAQTWAAKIVFATASCPQQANKMISQNRFDHFFNDNNVLSYSGSEQLREYVRKLVRMV